MMTFDGGRERWSWLEAKALRSASDIGLGALLWATAAVATLGTSYLPVLQGQGHARLYPSLLAILLAAIGTLLLVRGAVGRTPPSTRWRAWEIALLLVLGAPSVLGVWYLLNNPMPAFVLLHNGPAEYAANALLLLSLPIAFSTSRLRAIGMVLLGLLLGAVGDTGLYRMTMGIEQLADGFNFRLVVLPGLVWVADGMICVLSPALMLATYMQRVAGWHDPKVSAIAALGLRVVAALVVAASCWLAFGQLGAWGVGALLAFGLLGVACKLLAWSRPALLIGFACSWFLEQQLTTALEVSRGSAVILLRSPLSTMLLAATGIVLVVAMALSLRRAFAQGTQA